MALTPLSGIAACAVSPSAWTAVSPAALSNVICSSYSSTPGSAQARRTARADAGTALGAEPPVISVPASQGTTRSKPYIPFSPIQTGYSESGVKAKKGALRTER